MPDAQIFETLGLQLRKEGTQERGECPFCGKDKFYLNPTRSVWDCKVCGKSGNEVTIISQIHEAVYRPAMGDRQYGRLASYRGIPEQSFRSSPLVGWDEAGGRFVWCVRKPDGKAIGLRTWKPPAPGKKAPVHNLKGC